MWNFGKKALVSGIMAVISASAMVVVTSFIKGGPKAVGQIKLEDIL